VIEGDEDKEAGERGLNLVDLTERQTNVPGKMNLNRDWNEAYSSDDQFEDADLKLGRRGQDEVFVERHAVVAGRRAVVDQDLQAADDLSYSASQAVADFRDRRSGVVEEKVHHEFVHAGIISSPNKYVKKKADEGEGEDQYQPWVAVDLDGTVLEDPTDEDYAAMEDLVLQTGEEQQPILKDPLPGAAESLKELMTLGWRVSIYTARFSDDLDPNTTARFRDEIERHLEMHGVPFSDIWIGMKPRADYYVDNKAVAMDAENGGWHSVLQELTYFDPNGPQGEDHAVQFQDEEMDREGVAIVDTVEDEQENGWLDTDETRHDRSIPRPPASETMVYGS
jgi:hypothetical protein